MHRFETWQHAEEVDHRVDRDLWTHGGTPWVECLPRQRNLWMSP